MKNDKTTKFRVWNIKNNKWVNPADFLEVNTRGYLICENNNNLRNSIVQQFTGLLDKNNKEIYEGDIINFETYGIPHGPERDYIKNAEVYYDEKLVSFCFGRFGSEEHEYTYQMIDRIDEKTIEIIGNIFESAILHGKPSWNEIYENQ